ATGVYFTGGAQARITDALLLKGIPSPVLKAICALQARGGVVAGTSAGAAIMSEHMFRDPPDTLTVMQRGPVADVDVGDGLGFVGPGLFVDQHFLRRGRIGRMLAAMHAEQIKWGLGVDEDSGAIVHNGTVEAIGSRGIVLVDLADATSDPARGAFNLRGVRLHYLEQGDLAELGTRSVRPAAAKRSGQLLDPATPEYSPYYSRVPFYADFLGDNTLATAMATLIDSAAADVSGLAFAPSPDDAPHRDLGFVFRLYKGIGSRGWLATQRGDQRYTVEGLYLDIEPGRMARPLHTPWQATP
ncbi:MAG: cyanophycinase, partial [Pseudomonadota bacterium]|nr:cyanophycinase [Pseudomonadota bacterium]